MFSELTVIPAFVNGMLGMDIDVPHRAIKLAPHLPPDWPEVTVRQFPFGIEKLNLTLRQKPEVLNAAFEFSGAQPVQIAYAPALPAGSTVHAVLQNGKPVPFRIEDDESDIHVLVSLVATQKCDIEIQYSPGVAFQVEWQSLHEGDTSQNLRVLRSAYRNGVMQLLLEGLPDHDYRLRIFSPWGIKRSKGADSLIDVLGAKMLVLTPRVFRLQAGKLPRVIRVGPSNCNSRNNALCRGLLPRETPSA